jgi:ricin-type beta-trefoil lectin protein
VFRRLRVIAFTAVMLVCSVAVAVPASAALPQSDVPLIWPNRATGYCLGVSRGDVTNGTPIIVWRCNGNSDQTWTVSQIVTNANIAFTLRNGTNRNKCLTATGQGNGAAFVISDCKPLGQNMDQQFTYEDGQLAPCTIFWSSYSGKVVGVTGQSVNEGARVIQWDYLTHGDQEWCSQPPS